MGQMLQATGLEVAHSVTCTAQYYCTKSRVELPTSDTQDNVPSCPLVDDTWVLASDWSPSAPMTSLFFSPSLFLLLAESYCSLHKHDHTRAHKNTHAHVHTQSYGSQLPLFSVSTGGCHGDVHWKHKQRQKTKKERSREHLQTFNNFHQSQPAPMAFMCARLFLTRWPELDDDDDDDDDEGVKKR